MGARWQRKSLLRVDLVSARRRSVLFDSDRFVGGEAGVGVVEDSRQDVVRGPGVVGAVVGVGVRCDVASLVSILAADSSIAAR